MQTSRWFLSAVLAFAALPAMAAPPLDLYQERFASTPTPQAFAPTRVVHDGTPYSEAFYAPAETRPSLPALASGAPYTEAFFTPPASAALTSTSEQPKSQVARCPCPCRGSAG